MPEPLCLCQDCGRVKLFTPELHAGEELCECGGEFCGCDSCSSDAEKSEVRMKTKSLSACIQEAIDSLRKHVAQACDVASEQEVLQAFEDEIGAEIDGWKMRLQEIGDSDEAD